ncbi:MULTISPECIES: PilZ domain-containing protein [unclassified Ensifer]|uniref:PilZ domain-containing protein n=1 Tax=unclassified Ensifer TaxID=2633371 RepID=UPI00081334FF|nr:MULTISPECIES: PilZ domain-containing protein [unclassified Ensifer]OCP16601.1 pilus assembly protein PilZ [Ensifer sp. LC54]OCP20207.1 pilus assembly protein PilZ [Ensifer sp. LC384]OCP36771.1 pilus assembly protein PilZ [Ensifer sp. LC163]
MQQTMYSCVPSPFYERRYERFSIGHAATLTTVQPGLGSVSVRTCRMIDISRGGASFAVQTTIGLPQHYYLHIIGTSLRIGCAEVYRNGDRIGVQFIKPIEQTLLREIIRQEFFTGQDAKAPKRR